ncbi:TetR/AcrR family transcriptional regulator [Pedobacter sp. MC2016-24]|uniref:TetR/AcrR family transcriptional regulator n=1 Tax=Pedobacter sp. MC2016-24 TaxID=2780090 RepID=UPI0018800B61|nr:TetR/AcrR family transcriptional regulator [Pedobacter sp. MC2016-24]MBE9602206.1 TetR/AcrR family transcriptional regulator [Pedobacter sp. MC2016-24]
MIDTREHILNTSLKLFLQKSFKEVTMKEIVETTGLSKGAFYHYFSSKEKVFEEVVDFFLSDFMKFDFSNLSHDSLKSFYSDYLKSMEEKIQSAGKIGLVTGDTFNANHYFLLFDALKMLPSFKDKHLEHNQNELNAWTEIVTSAKKSGEINSKIPDELIAKTFIYLGDGFGMHLIIDGAASKMHELKPLFDGIYMGFRA